MGEDWDAQEFKKKSARSEALDSSSCKSYLDIALGIISITDDFAT